MPASDVQRRGADLLKWGFAGEAKEGPVENEQIDLSPYKEALLRKRGEILSSGGGVKPLQTSMENNSRQGDLADQASGNNEVHIQLKLKQTDAKILQAIEEALWRMEKGTYGVCRDCGEPIAPARLNAIPWTRVCITCKEKQSA
jgi:RNA polymerase-binding transcription factor